MTPTKQKQNELRIESEHAQFVADQIYMKCYERMYLNECGCLKQIEDICNQEAKGVGAEELDPGEALYQAERKFIKSTKAQS